MNCTDIKEELETNFTFLQNFLMRSDNSNLVEPGQLRQFPSWEIEHLSPSKVSPKFVLFGQLTVLGFVSKAPSL